MPVGAIAAVGETSDIVLLKAADEVRSSIVTFPPTGRVRFDASTIPEPAKRTSHVTLRNV